MGRLFVDGQQKKAKFVLFLLFEAFVLAVIAAFVVSTTLLAPQTPLQKIESGLSGYITQNFPDKDLLFSKPQEGVNGFVYYVVQAHEPSPVRFLVYGSDSAGSSGDETRFRDTYRQRLALTLADEYIEEHPAPTSDRWTAELDDYALRVGRAVSKQLPRFSTWITDFQRAEGIADFDFVIPTPGAINGDEMVVEYMVEQDEIFPKGNLEQAQNDTTALFVPRELVGDAGVQYEDLPTPQYTIDEVAK